MADSFWCEECRSFHVDPRNKKHWEQLKCFRPWESWAKQKDETFEVIKKMAPAVLDESQAPRDD